MTEATEGLILEILKSIQGRLGRIELDISEIKSRLSHVEVSVAQQAVQTAEINGRMDRFDERLSRIERRLDLTAA